MHEVIFVAKFVEHKIRNPMRRLLTSILCCSALLTASAQEPDTATDGSTSKEEKNRNVMLNASSSNQPRQISIGLPEGEAVDIFEDGTPVSYLFWPDYPYYSWRGGVSTASQSLLSLSESALQYGQCKYVLTSTSVQAGDSFQGLANYTLDTYGKQIFDVNISTPMGRGWGFSLGSYQGFDPGSNRLDALDIQDRMQIYKANLTKSFAEGRGLFAVNYKYARRTAISDNTGLFYFNGEDGSVDQYGDFDLGHDQLLPNYDYIEYFSIRTGEMTRRSLRDAATSDNHQLTLNLDYNFDNGNRLKISSKLKDAVDNTIFFKLGGLYNVGAADGFTFEDGTPYAGMVQDRYLLYFEGAERSWMTTATLTGRTDDGRHDWRLGANLWFNRARIYANSWINPHEGAANPRKLLSNGSAGSIYNEGSEYYDGNENRLALFASDDWSVGERLWLSLGVRLEWMHQKGDAALAFTDDGQLIEPANVRGYKFSLKDAKINEFGAYDWFNPSYTLNARYTIVDGFGLVGEYVGVRQRPNLQDFAGPFMPKMDAINVNMVRAGIYWNNSWMELTSQFTYIGQTNFKYRDQFTNPNDASETTILPIVYDVATMGWTTDVVLTPFRGFSFHGLFTYQDPKYKNFTFQPIFSDGAGERYDFNDKNVLGMSKVIVELDPSYEVDRWRFWLSLRYQSKQYINRTNSLYFKGRWETFGGVDFALNDKVKFSLNVINILNQKGASGSIAAADLLTDVAAYNRGYLMSGQYIRPFTVELSTSIKF